MHIVSSGRDKMQAKNQAPRMQQLSSRGCEIRAHQGQRLHAKWLMTERAILLGSTKFTKASQSNVERGVVLTGLDEETIASQQHWFDRLFKGGAKYTDGMGDPMPPSPAR